MSDFISKSEISQPKFLGSKSPEEYFLESNLNRFTKDSFLRRASKRLQRRLTRLMVVLASCVFQNRQLKKKLSPNEIQRVLVLRWDLLGDMVATTPVFNLLKMINPTIEIDLLASDKNVGCVEGDERLTNIYLFKKNLSFLRTAIQIRQRKYDLVLSFIQIKSMADGLLSNLLAPNAVKASSRRKAKYRPFFNVCATVGIGAAHSVDKFFAVPLSAIDSPISKPTLSLFLSSEALTKAQEFITSNNLTRYLFVNFAAGGSHREWGFENYEAFLNLVLKLDKTVEVILLSIPDNFAHVQQLKSKLQDQRVFVFPPESNIQVVSALLSKSWMVFSPDTSIIHIASATHRPVLGLYTLIATIPQEWLPYNVPYRAVLTEGIIPISTISVERVFVAFQELRKELLQHAAENQIKSELLQRNHE